MAFAPAPTALRKKLLNHLRVCISHIIDLKNVLHVAGLIIYMFVKKFKVFGKILDGYAYSERPPGSKNVV